MIDLFIKRKHDVVNAMRPEKDLVEMRSPISLCLSRFIRTWGTHCTSENLLM